MRPREADGQTCSRKRQNAQNCLIVWCLYDSRRFFSCTQRFSWAPMSTTALDRNGLLQQPKLIYIFCWGFSLTANAADSERKRGRLFLFVSWCIPCAYIVVFAGQWEKWAWRLCPVNPKRERFAGCFRWLVRSRQWRGERELRNVCAGLQTIPCMVPKRSFWKYIFKALSP